MSTRLLVTGFGPFPGVPANSSAALVRALAGAPPESFGGAILKPIVLPTEYRRSWRILANAWRRFAPDVVLHFGVSRRAERVVVETRATRRLDPALPDAAGFVPARGEARRSGPVERVATIDTAAILGALADAGCPAGLSQDAGLYLCNATLYRSLAHAAGSPVRVGFVHIPPEGPFWTAARLKRAGDTVVASVAVRRGFGPGPSGQARG